MLPRYLSGAEARKDSTDPVRYIMFLLLGILVVGRG